MGASASAAAHADHTVGAMDSDDPNRGRGGYGVVLVRGSRVTRLSFILARADMVYLDGAASTAARPLAAHERMPLTRPA